MTSLCTVTAEVYQASDLSAAVAVNKDLAVLRNPDLLPEEAKLGSGGGDPRNRAVFQTL